jgi:hypothetical protein
MLDPAEAFVSSGSIAVSRVPVEKLPFEVKVQAAPAPQPERAAAEADARSDEASGSLLRALQRPR